MCDEFSLAILELSTFLPCRFVASPCVPCVCQCHGACRFLRSPNRKKKEKASDRFWFCRDYSRRKKLTAEVYEFDVSQGDRFVAKTILGTAKRDNRLSIDPSVLRGHGTCLTCKEGGGGCKALMYRVEISNGCTRASVHNP